MKKYIYLLMVIPVVLMSCKDSDAYQVSGFTLDPEMNGKMVYMHSFSDDAIIDSTTIQRNAFTFKGHVKGSKFCRIDVEDEFAVFILEPGTIEVDLFTHIKPKGTKLNVLLDRLYVLEDSMRQVTYEQFNRIKEETSNEQDLNSRWESYFDGEWKPEMLGRLRPYFDENKDNAIGGFVLSLLSRFASAAQFDTFYDEAGENVKSMKFVEDIYDNYLIVRRTEVGQPFTDFTIMDEDSSPVRFSDYVGKGKYVLVDFWASWCGPCRAETPNIAALYDKYKDRNFEVLGVAVWDKLEESKKAIKELNMTWPNILNAETIPTDIYSIRGIPYIMLFAPDGTILHKGIRGDQMISIVDNLFR